YRHYKAILHRLFDVRAALLRFFDDPDAFRVLQSRTGLLVSGSTALQLLGRRSFGCTDLDLYVEQHAAVVVTWWLSMHDYIRLPRYYADNALLPDIAGPELRSEARNCAYPLRRGQILFKFVHQRRRSLKIDLIVCCDSALCGILDFHSSVVMNFIAADCAVSLFPHSTFTLGLSLVFRYDDSSRTAAVLDKYKWRGY
ncbi:hypothetical protein AURDEDRAFT_38004, partial [Auricularia subglabra TFB-10046 SS5]